MNSNANMLGLGQEIKTLPNMSSRLKSYKQSLLTSFFTTSLACSQAESFVLLPKKEAGQQASFLDDSSLRFVHNLAVYTIHILEMSHLKINKQKKKNSSGYSGTILLLMLFVGVSLLTFLARLTRLTVLSMGSCYTQTYLESTL